MEPKMSLWPEIMATANKPLSLVALLLLLAATWVLPSSDIAKHNPSLFSVLLGLCIIGVFVVAIFEISTKNNKEKIIQAQESITLAETLGQCVADASRAHISNLDIPEERVQAYARLALFVKGPSGVTNAEFRALASEAIVHYASTQGGCKKSELNELIQELSV